MVRSLLLDGTISYPSLDEAAMESYLLRLDDVARRGYATNYGESSVDEAGVAAPVFDHRGDTVAAVLIPAPRFRVSPERLQTLGQTCLKTALLITTRLGGSQQCDRDTGIS